MPTMTQSTQPRNQVRVAIIEDHVLFAQSLEVSLSIEGYDVRRVPLSIDSGTAASVLSAVTRAQPRVVLLDLDLGSFGDGVRLIGPLTQAGSAVVVVTSSIDKARWGECVRYGAQKVLPKTSSLNTILATVRRIGEGRCVMETGEREELLHLWNECTIQRLDLRTKLHKLTQREREVLGHLMLGRTVRDIAAQGFVSEATVRTQVKSILAKLDVSSQLAAVGLAHHVGWRSPLN